MGRVVGFLFILIGLVGLGISMADRSSIETLFGSPGGEAVTAAGDGSADAEPPSEAAPEPVTTAASPPKVDPAPAEQAERTEQPKQPKQNATVVTELDAGDVKVIERGDDVSPDALPWVDVTTANDTVREDSDHVNFVLTLSEPVDRSIIVIFTTVDGSARHNEDYLGQRGTVTFRPGIVTAEIRTPLVDDEIKESDEQFALILNGAPGIVNLPSKRIVTTIKDND